MAETSYPSDGLKVEIIKRMNEYPMDTYEKSANTLAERCVWAQTIEALSKEELTDFALELIGLENQYGPWPFEDIGVDPSDWDGTSIKFYRSNSDFTLTKEQVKRIEEQGFTVARILYKDTWKKRADYLTPKQAELYARLKDKADV